MQIRAGWLFAAILAMVAVAWWLSRDPPERARSKREHAEHAAAQLAEDARPALYRWRDANGVLQITEEPPKGHKYERIDKDAPPAIEVRGDRE
jgi:hypothetical protein